MVVSLVVLIAAAVWLVRREADHAEDYRARKAAVARQADVDARAMRRLKAVKANVAPGIGDQATRPGDQRRAPVGPADIEHAHDGLLLMLDHCFAEFRRRRPTDAGRLEVRFTLVKKAGYGTVEGIRVLDDPFDDHALRTCVQAGPREAFPVPMGDGRIDATIGLDLAPREGGAP
jgi:hypothetical protein